MQPFVSKIINGKAIGLTNMDEPTPMKNTSEPNSLKWEETFAKYCQTYKIRVTDHLALHTFISNLLSQQKEEGYVEILAAAESMETAREVRHFIKDKILRLDSK